MIYALGVCVHAHTHVCLCHGIHVDRSRQLARVCAVLLPCRSWELNSSGQTGQWALLYPKPFRWPIVFHCDAWSQCCMGTAQSLRSCLSFCCLLYLYSHSLHIVIYAETQYPKPNCKSLKYLLPGAEGWETNETASLHLLPPICFLWAAYRILTGLSHCLTFLHSLQSVRHFNALIEMSFP